MNGQAQGTRSAGVPLDALHHERMEIDYCREWIEAATPAVAAACGLSHTIADGALLAIASNLDFLSLNRALGVGIEVPATEALLDEIVSRYRAAHVPRFFLTVCPDTRPKELADWLARRGFERYNRWVKLGRAAGPAPEARTDMGIEEIGPERAADFGRIAAQGFGFPPVVAEWVALLVGRPRFRHYMAFDGDRPIGTAGLVRHGDWASFGFAAVLPEARGRGAQSALIARRIRDASEAGCRWLSVETGEDTTEKPSASFRNVRRLGFEVAYLRENWIWKAG